MIDYVVISPKGTIQPNKYGNSIETLSVCYITHKLYWRGKKKKKKEKLSGLIVIRI